MPGSFYPDWVTVRDKAYNWAYSQAHAETRNVQWRKRYATDAAYAKHVKACAKKYRANHREQRGVYDKEYYAKNKKAVSARRKASYAKYIRVHRQKNKQALVDMLGGCCSRCGYDECIAAFDFHHRDPVTKELNIASALDGELASLVVEIQKCDLLCANCHRMLHWERDN